MHLNFAKLRAVVRQILATCFSFPFHTTKDAKMSTLLVKNATVLVTMDNHQREIASGGLFIRDGFIEQVGPTAELPGRRLIIFSEEK